MKFNITDSDNTQQLKDGMIQLTDANGKVLQIKDEDIVDASTTMANDKTIIQDSDNQVVKFSVSISDSADNIMDEENLISDVKDGTATALDVTFEATHSGGNKNSVLYTSDSMSEDYKSWKFPFAKPLIKNHDMYTEPIGRVIDASFDQSDFDSNKDTINVTFRVSDSDAMQKFADGRYKTMSIGATSNHIQCNTCGKDILKDNTFKFCGHWRGETYANATCTWTVKDLEYKEGSIVNNPADMLAQVKKIRVIKPNKNANAASSSDNDNSTIVESVSIIDNLIIDVNKTVIDNNNEPEVSNDGTQVNDGTQSEALDDANAKIAELEQKLEDSVNDKNLLDEEISVKDKQIESMTAESDANQSILTTLKDQAKKLAILNKQLLVDNLKATKPDITDEDIENKSASDIHKMITDAKAAQRVIPTVNNPGATINDNNTVIDDENKENKTQEKETVSMKDMEEVLLDIFTR